MYKRFFKRERMSSREKILFARRLSLYLSAGISLLGALELIYDSHPTGAHGRIVTTLLYEVSRGTSLSKALSLFPRSFTPFYINMVSVGEASGTFSETFLHLADALSQQVQLRRSVISSLIYPCIVLFGCISVSGFLVFFVFPKIIPLFKSMHGQLPLTTRMLLGLSTFGKEHWISAISSIVGVAFVAGYAVRSKKVRHTIDSTILHIPVLTSSIRTFNLASIFRTLSVLLHSGARLDTSIRLSRDSISNQIYAHSLGDIEKTILSGLSCSSAMKHFPLLYPTVAVQLIRAGELTGTLPETAHSLCSMYEDELAEQLALYATLIEPILMVVMGIVVGFIALAIITPMYSITQALTIH